MSTIIDRGRDEIRRQEAEQKAQEERDRAASFKRTVSWFRFMGHFYERSDHMIPNPNYRSPYGTEPRMIENPDNPWPPIENWEPVEPVRGQTTASTFVCEGVRYVCRWKYEGGWDLAEWDDGWWPEWYVVVDRPKWFGLSTKKVEVSVPPRAASVARVLAGEDS